MMTDTDLRRLRDQGPTPATPPIDAVLHRANDMKRRARRQRLAAGATVLVVIMALVAAPWNLRAHHGVAGADVLAAVASNGGCEGTARRSTPAEADAVRFLPSYVPVGYRIDDAYANHMTDSACFRFLTRVVYTQRTGPDAVAATITISTGSERVSRVDCGADGVPKPVDEPATDFQRCIQVRGHSGALVHVLDWTSVAWIEPNVGAVTLRATALAPETVVELASRLATPGDGKLELPAAAVPAGYSLAYENWHQVSELATYDVFRGDFVQGPLALRDSSPELFIDVTQSRRPLWALVPYVGSFDLVDVQGHEGIAYDDEGGAGVQWKVGDNLFGVVAPRGVSRAEALRVARSFAPVGRGDARLIDPAK